MKSMIEKDKLLRHLKNNKEVILYTILIVIIFFLCNILNNFLEYKSYEEEINQYDLVEFQDLGLIVRESSLIKIENEVSMYVQNEELLETAEYLELDTYTITKDLESIYEQNIALTELINTTDENYHYKSVDQNNKSYTNMLLVLFLLLILLINHRKIIKFFYANSNVSNDVALRKIYKKIKYVIIILMLLITIFLVYFGRNYVEYNSYKEDINRYELTQYQNIGFIIKDSTLEKINKEIENQKKLEDLVLEAETLGIKVNEILLPSMTNTDEKIEIISSSIENYEPPNDNIKENSSDEVDLVEVNEEETYDYSESTYDSSGCDSSIEDCNTNEKVDSPPSAPTEEENCEPKAEDCNDEGKVDEPPIVEETCDPITEDCDGDGNIDTPPEEEVCDPEIMDCDGDGEVVSPPQIQPMNHGNNRNYTYIKLV